MKRKMTRARLLVGGLLTMGLLISAQPDAKADCVYLKLYAKRKNSTPAWVYGQHNPCVAPTPFNWGVGHIEDNTTTVDAAPNGSPAGFYLETRVPLP